MAKPPVWASWHWLSQQLLEYWYLLKTARCLPQGPRQPFGSIFGPWSLCRLELQTKCLSVTGEGCTIFGWHFKHPGHVLQPQPRERSRTG